MSQSKISVRSDGGAGPSYSEMNDQGAANWLVDWKLVNGIDTAMACWLGLRSTVKVDSVAPTATDISRRESSGAERSRRR